jgi:hypothetical protein
MCRVSGVTAILYGVGLSVAEQAWIDWATTQGQQQLVQTHIKAQQDNIWMDAKMQ